jgi:hypothetical protein
MTSHPRTMAAGNVRHAVRAGMTAVPGKSHGRPNQSDRLQVSAMDLSIEQIAQAFSGHRFAEVYPHFAQDVQWVSVGGSTLHGRDAVIEACEQSSEYLSQDRGRKRRRRRRHACRVRRRRQAIISRRVVRHLRLRKRRTGSDYVLYGRSRRGVRAPAAPPRTGRRRQVVRCWTSDGSSARLGNHDAPGHHAGRAAHAAMSRSATVRMPVLIAAGLRLPNPSTSRAGPSKALTR